MPTLLASLGVGAWVVVCVVAGAWLLARHLLTLPTPTIDDPTLRTAIAAQRHADQRDRWLVLHVLYDDCACSRRVLDHLRATPRPADLVERVVYVTDAASPPPGLVAGLRARGFDVDVASPEQLVARYHLEAAPLLVVVDPRGAVRYLGGYTARKQLADVRDLAIIAVSRVGLTVAPLPAFGCAVSRGLRDKLDPLRI